MVMDKKGKCITQLYRKYINLISISTVKIRYVNKMRNK